MKALTRSVSRLRAAMVCVLACGSASPWAVAQAVVPPGNGLAAISVSSVPAVAEREKLLSESFVEVRDAAGFPLGCRQGFAALAKTRDFELANPGQPYQATDVIGMAPRLPSRRLLFGGVSSDRCVLFYEVGGFAPYRSVVVMDRRGSGPAIPVWGGSGGKNPGDLHALISQIAGGGFTRLIGY